MKRKKTAQNAKEPAKPADSYQRVFNEKGERVRGLWLRAGRFYAQLRATDGKPYRYRLDHAQTVPQAVLARQALKLKHAAGQLLPPAELARRKPADQDPEGTRQGGSGPESKTPEERKLKNAVASYQADRDGLKKKSPGTAKREDSSLRFWVSRYGEWDLLDVKNLQLSEFGQWRRQTHQVEGRAVDLDVMALNHVYDFARTMDIIPKDHPRLTWDTLAGPPSKDELLTPEQMDELCNAALLDPGALELLDPRVRHLRQAQELTGQAFHDYLRLLQHAGGREHETCLQEWTHVTWSRQAEFRGDGGPDFKRGDKIPGNLFFPGERAKAGGGEPAEDRWVDFNDHLETHLLAMYQRQDPSSDWMFPGRNEGEPIQRFSRQLERVKRELRRKWEASVPEKEAKKSQWFDRFTFQWMRHYFISHCVMAGIDYKTIATWVSHRDGGILIGRVYGHLYQAHGRAMAQKLNQHQQNHR